MEACVGKLWPPEVGHVRETVTRCGLCLFGDDYVSTLVMSAALSLILVAKSLRSGIPVMSKRLLSVTAYTTLEYVETTAVGETFEWDSVAVVNATADDEEPDAVNLQLECDNITEEYLPKHMLDLELTPDQARTLAADLERYADRVEDATVED